MSDPFSITVGVIALLGAVAQTKGVVDDARHANQEMGRLLEEVTGWFILLNQLKDRLKGAKVEDEWYKGLLAMAKPVRTISPDGKFIPTIGKYQPDGIFTQLQKAYDELAGELRPKNGWRKFSKRLMWFWDKESVNQKLAAIDRLASLINSILNQDSFPLFQAIKEDTSATRKNISVTEESHCHKKAADGRAAERRRKEAGERKKGHCSVVITT